MASNTIPGARARAATATVATDTKQLARAQPKVSIAEGVRKEDGTFRESFIWPEATMTVPA